MSLTKYDKELIWHPFTQEKTADTVIPIKRALGSYLYDENDKVYLDLVSSWWVNIHGHANKEIANAIYNQCLTLEHVIFAGFTHKPAVEICQMLKKLLPEPLTKFFFTDNGSTATEVALKMCYQYHVNKGCNTRTSFLCFEGGYHGDTFGAMSVGIGSGFHDKFKKLCFSAVVIPFAETWFEDKEVEKKEAHAIDVLNKYLKDNHENIAAFIMEPLIQGAAGMRMCRPQFINLVVDLVRLYNILVIFDEVFVGFGRTGTNFALENLDVVPDILCLSKGLTGGFLPLALSVVTQEIYECFLGNEFDTALAHGHSYTANPLGCAAAIASLKILIKPSTSKAIKEINETHEKNLRALQERCHIVIEHARLTGTVAAFDIKDKTIVKYFKSKCLQNGLLIRPLNTTVYIVPPYCTTKDELDNAYKVITDILSEKF